MKRVRSCFPSILHIFRQIFCTLQPEIHPLPLRHWKLNGEVFRVPLNSVSLRKIESFYKAEARWSNYCWRLEVYHILASLAFRTCALRSKKQEIGTGSTRSKYFIIVSLLLGFVKLVALHFIAASLPGI